MLGIVVVIMVVIARVFVCSGKIGAIPLEHSAIAMGGIIQVHYIAHDAVIFVGVLLGEIVAVGFGGGEVLRRTPLTICQRGTV